MSAISGTSFIFCYLNQQYGTTAWCLLSSPPQLSWDLAQPREQLGQPHTLHLWNMAAFPTVWRPKLMKPFSVFQKKKKRPLSPFKKFLNTKNIWTISLLSPSGNYNIPWWSSLRVTVTLAQHNNLVHRYLAYLTISQNVMDDNMRIGLKELKTASDQKKI